MGESQFEKMPTSDNEPKGEEEEAQEKVQEMGDTVEEIADRTAEVGGVVDVGNEEKPVISENVAMADTEAGYEYVANQKEEIEAQEQDEEDRKDVDEALAVEAEAVGVRESAGEELAEEAMDKSAREGVQAEVEAEQERQKENKSDVDDEMVAGFDTVEASESAREELAEETMDKSAREVVQAKEEAEREASQVAQELVLDDGVEVVLPVLELSDEGLKARRTVVQERLARRRQGSNQYENRAGEALELMMGKEDLKLEPEPEQKLMGALNLHKLDDSEAEEQRQKYLGMLYKDIEHAGSIDKRSNWVARNISTWFEKAAARWEMAKGWRKLKVLSINPGNKEVIRVREGAIKTMREAALDKKDVNKQIRVLLDQMADELELVNLHEVQENKPRWWRRMWGGAEKPESVTANVVQKSDQPEVVRKIKNKKLEVEEEANTQTAA